MEIFENIGPIISAGSALVTVTVVVVGLKWQSKINADKNRDQDQALGVINEVLEQTMQKHIGLKVHVARLEERQVADRQRNDERLQTFQETVSDQNARIDKQLSEIFRRLNNPA